MHLFLSVFSVCEIIFAAYNNSSRLYFDLFRLFWCRAINRPLSICWELLIAILISLALGWLFLSLPLDRRAGINDRFGFVCSILLVGQLPLALIGTRTGKQAATDHWLYTFCLKTKKIVCVCRNDLWQPTMRYAIHVGGRMSV